MWFAIPKEGVMGLMEIGANWETIRNLFRNSFLSSLHYAMATTNADGSPHVTPIAALILREDRTGFYFEVYTDKMSKNLSKDRRVCVMAVNSDLLFWARSFMEGKFDVPPAVRLGGTVGERREATQEEIAVWRERVEFAREMKGYDLLWKTMRYVRDIYFDSFEPVYLGAMTAELWKSP